MTDKCQIHKCHVCGEPLDEATQTIIWIEDDVPLCEYCAQRELESSLHIGTRVYADFCGNPDCWCTHGGSAMER